MAQVISKVKNSQEGYLIIESLMALLLGAVVAMTFIFSSSSGLSRSDRTRKELLIRSICEEKMNMIIENPEAFSDKLTLTPSEETYEYKEEEGDPKNNGNYKVRVTYKRFEVPGLDQIQGKEEKEDNSQNQLNEKIYKNVQKNLKELIWQVKVEVWNAETPDDIFSLATYLYNNEAMVKIDAL